MVDNSKLVPGCAIVESGAVVGLRCVYFFCTFYRAVVGCGLYEAAVVP